MAADGADPYKEKKRSMAERVDAWGENQKAARRNLPLKRARIQRAYRRAVKDELRYGEDADPDSVRRKPWRKWAGPTRATRLQRQRLRREGLQSSPRKSEEARRRRRARRGRDYA